MKKGFSEIGFVGLGKMGSKMVHRILSRSEIKVVVYNRSPEPIRTAVKEGAISSRNIDELVSKLKSDRKVVWMMLPAGAITEKFFREILKHFSKGDIIIDGGNSNFKDSIRRFGEANKKGIDFLDIGVSGGVIGAELGYSMSVSGNKKTFDYVKPVLDVLCLKGGCSFVSESPGAGHYVKMIHNSIEYGMMQSIAEGFDLLKNGSYKNLNLKNIAHIWNQGSIIRSFLLESTEKALSDEGNNLSDIEPYVDDSGEGEWAVIEAVEKKIPYLVNTEALHARRISRQKNSYDFKLLSAVRNQFGGHKVRKRS